MSRLLMKSFLRQFFRVELHYPMPSFVFLTIAVVALLQYPASVLFVPQSLSIAILINEILVVAGVPLAIAFWKKIELPRLFPFLRPSWHLVVWSIVLMVGADIVIDYLTAASELFLPLPEEHRATLEKVMAAPSLSAFGMKLGLICLLPGICEEILFRGFCQTSLTAHLGTKPAIMITALLFALLHSNPWYFHLYVLLGFLLSWLYAVSGTLWIPILAHTLNNAWTFTSHHLGLEIPVRTFFHPIDIMLLGFGLLLVIVAVRKIIKFSLYSGKPFL